MSERELAEIVHPVVLIRVARAFQPGMSDLALYEATRGVWKIGARREHVRCALAVYQGIVQEVYEIRHWQPAWMTPYATRTFESTAVPGRFEFVGMVAADAVRNQYCGKAVVHYFSRGAQNPITYVDTPI